MTGPRGPQRMIFGRTDREDHVDAGGGLAAGNNPVSRK